VSRYSSVRQTLKTGIISTVGGTVLTALMSSTRSRLISGEEVERGYVEGRRPAVYVLWHGRLLPCAYRYRRYRLGTLISRNRDGDYIAGVVRRWGFTVIRGSSSRGGSSALRGIVRMLQSGRSVALTPDGPRGPRQQMKAGPVLAAQMAGVPIIPVSAAASSGRYFGSWDRFLVPAPFAVTPVALGEPLVVPADLSGGDLDDVVRQVGESLNRLTTLVDEAAR
jgi:lysophospholipid acyltransferase (LPLAT)-like uncharacterized protein